VQSRLKDGKRTWLKYCRNFPKNLVLSFFILAKTRLTKEDETKSLWSWTNNFLQLTLNFFCELICFYFLIDQEARGCYVYFVAKLTELLDTIFFVLRKKDNQVSFLHLYHHSVMPLISWGCTKYYPGGHGTFIGVINSFVHIVMYFYYMMAAMGPEFQKYLWWKHWITNLQMVRLLYINICPNNYYNLLQRSK
jgi:GNS1/SUR4 family